MNSQYNLDITIVNDVVNVAKKYDVLKIVLFGSRARSDNHIKSDIDIAVYIDSFFNKKGHFMSDIDDINTLYKFDVVFIHEMSVDDDNSDLKLCIEKEGVVIYERY